MLVAFKTRYTHTGFGAVRPAHAVVDRFAVGLQYLNDDLGMAACAKHDNVFPVFLHRHISAFAIPPHPGEQITDRLTPHGRASLPTRTLAHRFHGQ